MEDKRASDHLPMEPLGRPPRGALVTYGLFLLGNGEAIRRLAATPRLWVVGLLFTVSAGLAREYDAEDLLAEPWHLLIAPGASLVAATALWLFVHASGTGRWMWSPAKPLESSVYPDSAPGLEPPPDNPPPAPRLRDDYLTFIGLFWLTAPLAWFYGIPYERFQSAGEAASSNLWTLQLVALWRVVLMIRVLQVLYGIGGVVASIIVLLFGTVVMLIALFTMPVPIFAVMGGVRLGDADRSLALLAMLGKIFGSFAAFVLLLLWTTTFLGKRRWTWQIAATTVPLRPLMILALVASAWWCLWLPITQPEQRLRGQVERALRADDLATGLTVLASHPPEAFPPHWDPPPRIGYTGDAKPDPGDVLLFLLDHPSLLEQPYGAHCQRLFEDKLIAQGWIYMQSLTRNRTALANLVTLLERMPDAERLMHPELPPHERDRDLYGLHRVLSGVSVSDDPAMRQRINALLERYPLR